MWEGAHTLFILNNFDFTYTVQQKGTSLKANFTEYVVQHTLYSSSLFHLHHPDTRDYTYVEIYYMQDNVTKLQYKR